MKKVVVLDTSILCVWLQIPGKETCGPKGEWTYDKVKQKIESEIESDSTLVLPFASVIETGNHIAQAHGDRHRAVNAFADHIENAMNGNSPWATFGNQSQLLNDAPLKKLLSKWRQSAIAGQSIGDAMIVELANFYSSYNVPVEIFTGDGGLKAYEPPFKPKIRPRRDK